MEEKAGIIRSTSRPSSCSALGTMNKNSQIISKVKPQIRIIHVFAPEIIKTDVANFREVVQRLTGKPSLSDKKKKEVNIYNMKQIIPGRNNKVLEEPSTMLNCVTTFLNKKIELRTGFLNPSGEEERWRNANSGGGFLDGLMEEFNQFPFLPSDATHMDAYGESQLA
ncbi:PREDICTED: VQ motif-containing protein 25-like [Nicotiana attenuata]|nr:PREDICTED: VQ motif-containing protein 25-like [Nicotiana attenuata]